jgi:hypothetical protein
MAKDKKSNIVRLAASKRTSKKSAPNTKKPGAPLPRAMIHKQVAEAIQDLNEQLLVAETIRHVAAPTGRTLVGSYPTFKIIEIALDTHIRGLYRLRARLAVIIDREGVRLPERLRFDDKEVALSLAAVAAFESVKLPERLRFDQKEVAP